MGLEHGHLAAQHVLRLAALALLLQLSDAGDHEQPGLECGRRAPCDAFVGLAEVLPSLGMADDCPVDPDLDEHAGRNLAREGAAVLPVDVLGRDRDLGVRQRQHRRLQRDRGRADGYVDPVEARQALTELEAELLCLGRAFEELPVSGDERHGIRSYDLGLLRGDAPRSQPRSRARARDRGGGHGGRALGGPRRQDRGRPGSRRRHADDAGHRQHAGHGRHRRGREGRGAHALQRRGDRQRRGAGGRRRRRSAGRDAADGERRAECDSRHRALRQGHDVLPGCSRLHGQDRCRPGCRGRHRHRRAAGRERAAHGGGEGHARGGHDGRRARPRPTCRPDRGAS